jgi:hypothetical protein
MCLMIDRPEGVEIPDSLLECAAFENPDGWGVMVADGGRVRTWKGFGLGKLRSAIRKIGDSEAIIHLRLATHGTTDTGNCHPFTFSAHGRQYGLAHNGILSGVPIRDKSKSDTWHYTRDIVARELRDDPECWADPLWVESHESFATKSNKVIVLRGDGEKVTFNRDQGCEWEGLWLSNRWSIPNRKRDLWPWEYPRRGNLIEITEKADYPPPWDDVTLDELMQLDEVQLREICLLYPDAIADAIIEGSYY